MFGPGILILNIHIIIMNREGSLFKLVRKLYHKMMKINSNIFHILAYFYSKNLSLDFDRYLVIAPHPDDEVLGCGGLLHRLVKRKKNVHVVILTQGEAAYNKQLISVSETINKRKALALDAAQIMGLTSKQYTFLDWGDGKLSENKNIENRQMELASIFKIFKPEIILVPHKVDKIGDHSHASAMIYDTIRDSSSSIKLMYYCVWIWFGLRYWLNWKKSYVLLLDKEERAVKSKAIDAYVLPVDEFGRPYSGDIGELPSICRWQKELFFEATCQK